MNAFKLSACVLACAAALPSYAADHAAEDISALWTNGKVMLDARTRYEYVNDDSTKRPAAAWTLRLRPAYQTGTWQGFSGLIEAEATAELDDNYNSTRNNQTQYLSVPDAESAEINQLLIKYVYSPQLDATVGRQRINLDNQRFVGGVAWRDNEQTYDAFSINLKPSKQLGFYYAYIDQINTFFGSQDPKPAATALRTPSDVDSQIHLIQAKYAYSPALNGVAYGYLMDIENWGAAKNVQSNATYGLRLTGKIDALRYVAEYAKQSDYADQPLSYDADYYNLEIGYTLPKSVATGEIALGYEMLGSSDGKKGFQTPLATKHKFNGWTDLFLNTPNAGLSDLYLNGSLTLLQKGKLGAEIHSYNSDIKSSHYGDEYGISFSHPVPMVKGLTGLAKYSLYKADEVDVFSKAAGNIDTDKIWLQLDYKY